MTERPQPPADGQISELPRRSFGTRLLAMLVAFVVGVIPAAAALLFFLDPLRRERKAVGPTSDSADEDGFFPVTSLDALPVALKPDEPNAPRMYKIVADLQDFWNKFPDTEIGAVYLRRKDDGTVQCFNARCPHLGCTVNYHETEEKYICPCHESAFSLNGERTNQIPPRDMDPLPTRVDENGVVWVQFTKFRAGIEERVPV